MKIEILDLARDDLIAGYHFYESQEAGLGKYYLICLYADIESLKIYAGIHQKIYLRFHRALSKRFPFAIYYTVEDSLIRVSAIIDCRKNPAWIRKHLKNA